MKLVATLLLFIVLLNAHSQQQATLLSENGLQRNLGESPAFSHVQVKKTTSFNIEGTTYFQEDLNPGKIRIVKNDEYIEGVDLRYDIFYDQLEVRANGVFFAAENELISDFVMNVGDVEHWFHNSITYAPDLGLGYIRSLYLGDKVSVFAKDSKRERKSDSSEPYSSARNTIEYLDQVDYYIYNKSNNGFTEIKSKKKLLERFPALKDFGSISKGDLKNEDFLPKLAMFLDKSK